MDEWIRWGVAGALAAVVGAVGWLVRLERRLNTKLDREQYDRETKLERQEIMQQLEKINDRGEKRDEYLHTLKHELAGTLNQINLKIAVMRATARNPGPEEDNGRE